MVLRFGLHWGSNPYVGNIATAGRSEVTALGDEVNEAARIEACASGGRALASKDLVERLDPEDAAALDLDPNSVTYTPLGELTTATEKARRDAPTIPVLRGVGRTLVRLKPLARVFFGAGGGDPTLAAQRPPSPRLAFERPNPGPARSARLTRLQQR